MLSSTLKSRIDLSNIPLKVKNSILCGIKGFLICNLAAFTTLQQYIYIKLHKNDVPSEILLTHITGKQNAQYATRHNLIPFAEAATVMPLVFISAYYLAKYGIIPNTNPLNMHMICLAICLAIMIIICISLRILKIRKDCCSYIEHPIYRDHTTTTSSLFVNFKGNSLVFQSKNTHKNPTYYTSGYYIINFLFSVLTTPLKLVIALLELLLFCVTILELPLSLIFDTVILIHNKIKNINQKETESFHQETYKINYHYSKETTNKAFSFLYAGIRDLIVTLSIGLLGFEYITPTNGEHPRSLISYIDQVFTTQAKKSEDIPNTDKEESKTSSCMSDASTESVRSCCKKKCC
ncbi:hypothetical protein [Ehrlichia ruminantium]|uniref:Uncharacterized protein n=2 Tax=Ehrlichia ruminantium TaxID=779 RepID=A0A0H3M0A6_EHRRW|nr:hypothetical protein [Ehrlichia ruminantium]QLK55296.1 hypothetical protein FDZ62_03470 [Ehrlichia ruminantium]QLK56212.1 hypothetical protein FDZ61_03460 [Ehrlichia ruminantium]QLK58042.1 hypothetical protein FDZ59_03445 [Ehrlichia ruminantium]UOD97612.1 hypothetical protein IMW64_03415 [Ehrlichia ruminantium]CAI27142.1 Hypothetical protein ERWE_CDS_06480 [Ehrlichia ruminantium str. Welgevonden]